VETALAALDEAEQAARGTGELRGVLRVAASSSFTERALIPRLDEFLVRNPKLRMVLLVNDQRQALVTEGVDVAFRFGSLDDSAATARRLGSIERVLVGSPAYLRRAGRPKAPADLKSHAIIEGPIGTDGWTFEKDGRRISLRLEGRVVVSANESAVAAAVTGLGIATTSITHLFAFCLIGRWVLWTYMRCFLLDAQQKQRRALWQNTGPTRFVSSHD